MKTSELIGHALDWAVAKCEGAPKEWRDNGPFFWDGVACIREFGHDIRFTPSTNWSQGGPIIERERLIIEPWGVSQWAASVGRMNLSYGPTPLIAAMRCYVASKLGDEVDIPNELKG